MVIVKLTVRGWQLLGSGVLEGLTVLILLVGEARGVSFPCSTRWHLSVGIMLICLRGIYEIRLSIGLSSKWCMQALLVLIHTPTLACMHWLIMDSHLLYRMRLADKSKGYGRAQCSHYMQVCRFIETLRLSRSCMSDTTCWTIFTYFSLRPLTSTTFWMTKVMHSVYVNLLCSCLLASM